MDRYDSAREHLATIGIRNTSWTNIAMAAEALDRGITLARDPKTRRMLLRHGGKTLFWRGGNTDHNSAMAKRLVKYKDVTNRYLRHRGVPAPDNAVFAAADISRAWKWAEDLGPVVLKPHDGNQGRDVFVGVEGMSDFVDAFAQVAAGHGEVLVETFHPGVEHRCLVIDGRLAAATRRRPASVLGDGESSIRELVEQKNQDRGRIHKPITIDDQAVRTLARSGHTVESVPAAGERVALRTTSNLHTGGDAVDATDDLTAQERAIVERGARVMQGLRIAALDVLLPREADHEAEPTIIELNGSPMTSMHHFPWEGTPRNVSALALDSMFPETASRS